MRSRSSPDRRQEGKDTFFFYIGGRLLDRMVLIQLGAFSLRHLQLLMRLGNLFYLFTPVKSKPKIPTWCSGPWPSNMHAAWCLVAHASLHHLHVDRRKPHGWWLLTLLWGLHERHRCCVTREKNSFPLVLGTATVSPESSTRSLIPEASAASSRRSTKDNRDWQWRRRYGVCCWLRMQPTINTTLSPKAYSRLKQAHRRRIEDTPLPSATQTRMNSCQLQVCMIWYSRFNAQHTQASCRSRAGGLVTSFTRSFGLARFDLHCWRWMSWNS